MKKNHYIWAIHYNWRPSGNSPTGEVYNHYYIGANYETTDWSRQANVTFIKPEDGYYLVSFDNGVDIKVSNVNKIIYAPDEFSEQKDS